MIRKLINVSVAVTFSLSLITPVPRAQAGEMVMPLLPAPGMMVQLSPAYAPAYLKGITIHPDNALQFDFLIHRGDGNLDDAQKQEEYKKLVKYFLASLTIADNDQWVNLSPYEKDRIVEGNFGKTEMGRDMLSQDYLLKQITSSLIYPESGLGKKFWNRIYERAKNEFNTTEIPVNTFNKVWITPETATVDESGNTAYIVNSHLKVMLEEDYLSLAKHSGIETKSTAHTTASQIIKTILLPELEKEVNEGKNFAPLRQIFSGMILATWYKKALKESLLGRIYADKAKIKGVDQDPQNDEIIYKKYLAAFKKGVFNYIKEDLDPYSQQTIPRKYFAGGVARHAGDVSFAQVSPARLQEVEAPELSSDDVMSVALQGTNGDAAMALNGQIFAYSAAGLLLTVGVPALVYFFRKDSKYNKYLKILEAPTDENLTYEGIREAIVYMHPNWRQKPEELMMYAQSSNRMLRVIAEQLIKEAGQSPGASLSNMAMVITLRNHEDTPYFKLGPTGKPRAFTVFRKDRYLGSVVISRGDDGKPIYLSIPAVTASLESLDLMRIISSSKEWDLIPMYARTPLRGGGLFYRSGLAPDIYVQMHPKELGIRAALIRKLAGKAQDPSDYLFQFSFFNNYLASDDEVSIYEVSIDASPEAQLNKGPIKALPLSPIDYYISNIVEIPDQPSFNLEGVVQPTKQEIKEWLIKETKTYGGRIPLKGNLYIGEKRSPRVLLLPLEKFIRDLQSGGMFIVKYQGRISAINQLRIVGDADRATVAPFGGIDLNSAHMAMLIKRDGQGVPLPLAQQDMAQLGEVNGFEPVIEEIRPATAVRLNKYGM